MSRAMPYRLELEHTSAHIMPYLGMKLSKGYRWRDTGLLDITPYRKSTASSIVLTSSSAHPRAVHQGRPMRLVKQYQSVSNSHRGIRDAITSLHARVAASDLQHPSLFRLIATLNGACTFSNASRHQGE